ncbi:MAG: hypothetical protein ACLPXT_00395 [Terracidiphilus sp.]
MAHQSYAEEQTKIAKEAAFATLGRAIADKVSGGEKPDKLLEDAVVRRQQEQEGGTRTTKFAALTRQIGDAVNSGDSTAELIKQLVELRCAELR